MSHLREDRTHLPHSTKRLKAWQVSGGQPAGVSLMSFDKDTAFACSYGWEQNANSPVCLPIEPWLTSWL